MVKAAEVVKRDLISLTMDRRVLYKDAPGTQKIRWKMARNGLGQTQSSAVLFVQLRLARGAALWI
jgi:hypothetical protein